MGNNLSQEVRDNNLSRSALGPGSQCWARLVEQQELFTNSHSPEVKSYIALKRCALIHPLHGSVPLHYFLARTGSSFSQHKLYTVLPVSNVHSRGMQLSPKKLPPPTTTCAVATR